MQRGYTPSPKILHPSVALLCVKEHRQGRIRIPISTMRDTWHGTHTRPQYSERQCCSSTTYPGLSWSCQCFKTIQTHRSGGRKEPIPGPSGKWILTENNCIKTPFYCSLNEIAQNSHNHILKWIIIRNATLPPPLSRHCKWMGLACAQIMQGALPHVLNPIDNAAVAALLL